MGPQQSRHTDKSDTCCCMLYAVCCMLHVMHACYACMLCMHVLHTCYACTVRIVCIVCIQFIVLNCVELYCIVLDWIVLNCIVSNCIVSNCRTSSGSSPFFQQRFVVGPGIVGPDAKATGPRLAQHLSGPRGAQLAACADPRNAGQKKKCTRHRAPHDSSIQFNTIQLNTNSIQ